MTLQKNIIMIIFGLSLYLMKRFSYSRLNKYEIKESYRVLQYQMNKVIQREKLFEQIFHQIVKTHNVSLTGGMLIIDNTTVDKSYSRNLDGASYVWDSRKGRSVYGYSIVHLTWVIDNLHIPLLSTTYVPGEIIPGKFTKRGNPRRRRADKTHSDLACELLSYAKNKLGIKPDLVAFDELYACEKVLKLIKGYNWVGIFALPSRRKFKGEQLNNRKWESQPEWGKLNSGIKVTLMKDGKNYYGTTKFGGSRHWIKSQWHKRWKIEEEFRFIKSELYFECCQSKSKRFQENHFTICWISFIAIELLSKELNLNWYQTKEEAHFHRHRLLEICSSLA